MRIALISLTLAAFFASYSAYTTKALIELGREAKSQQRAFLCFDAQGRVSTSDHDPVVECRRVAIRELPRHG